ncbi:MAG: acyl carrier protein [Eubacteriales bacterium]|nr:acyl carrier protein [Eubacteriales bacterium]
MTFEKVAKIIAEARDLDISEIKMDTSFEDMELDSLDVIEVVMAIEEAFGINIDTEGDLRTVEDLVKLVDNLK